MLSLAQAQTEWFTFKNCTELEAEMWFLTFLARWDRDLLRGTWCRSQTDHRACSVRFDVGPQFSRFRTTTATTVTRTQKTTQKATQKTTQKTAVRQDRDLGDHHVFRDDFHHRDHHGKHHNIARGTFWKNQTTKSFHMISYDYIILWFMWITAFDLNQFDSYCFILFYIFIITIVDNSCIIHVCSMLLRLPGSLRCALDLWDLRRPLRSPAFRVSPSTPRVATRVSRRDQAMQQLHPILAQTECEEAARPWNLPDFLWKHVKMVWKQDLKQHRPDPGPLVLYIFFKQNYIFVLQTSLWLSCGYRWRRQSCHKMFIDPKISQIIWNT